MTGCFARTTSESGRTDMSEWRSKNNGCPCYLCEKRKPGTGCHDKCEEFKAWKAGQEELKAEERKQHGVNTMSDAKRKALARKAVRVKRYGHGGIRDKNE